MPIVSYKWTVGSVNRRGLTTFEVQTAIFEALTYYAKTLMRKHFKSGNVFRYGYKGLTPEYARRKIREFGMKPVLVATGTLKQAVMNTWEVHKVGNRYTILWTVPDYGVYHIEGIRDGTVTDWRLPNQTEWTKVKDRIDLNLDKLRRKGNL